MIENNVHVFFLLFFYSGCVKNGWLTSEMWGSLLPQKGLALIAGLYQPA
ncbi:hypothetical protein EPIR_2195 [Erwinia piriflorinigrans CFBP 5888]|uniref:Uncharacterized protein n=1 Tax=Erwinia piriflorinigrans CFBP 5888 TaxID=1161919 RepID=V5Z9E9_9GAMM|nr:hypothetical protein EPIR_2195 [Erwinia piriflorinigrans CFBP 5888]